MIETYYYSTLSNTLHDSKTDAQQAEDEYVKKYFDDLEDRAAIRRRQLRKLIRKDTRFKNFDYFK